MVVWRIRAGEILPSPDAPCAARRGCSPGASRGAPVPGEFPVNDLFIRYIISLFLGK